MDIKRNLIETIGHTPLVRMERIAVPYQAVAEIVAKVERFNPGGSVKDRAALSMIEDAEEKGRIRPGATLIEPTSGNTGIGLASVAASKGYKTIFVMPETMSIERRKLLLGYGAQIVLTEGAKGMKGAIEKAAELEKEMENAVILGQFVNPANPKAHYRTTGPEIWEDTDGAVDIFVAGAGTGGTVTGVGRYLKEKKASVKVIVAEPDKSPVLSGGNPGPHGLQGIGAGFVPEILDTGIYDAVSRVTEEEAYGASRLLAEKEGILTGITSGAALHTALKEAEKAENEGKIIVALLPDTGERYLSTPLFN